MSLKVEGPAGEPAHAPKRRRRGAELEKALLDAAWAELMESGYETMTSVSYTHLTLPTTERG